MYNGIKKTVIRFAESWKRVSLYASQTAYYMLFSSIPFLMLVMMLIQGIFPGFTDSVVEIISEAAPDFFSKLPDDFWDSFLSADVSIVSITVMGVLWSASKGVKSLRAGLCSVYGREDSSNWALRYLVSFLHTILFVVLSVVMLVVTVWGNTLYLYIDSRGLWVSEVFEFVMKFRIIIFFFAVSFAVAIIYKVLAAREDKLKQLLPGAVFSGIAWMVYSQLFSLYIRYFSKYNILYGSIGLIPIIMLWIYSCIAILLLGAEFNVYMKKRPIISG